MAIDPIAAQSVNAAAPRPPVVHPDQAAKKDASAADGDQDLSFWDVLDIVNPLQHIPVVNSVYRAITGDEIKPAMQISGDILFGGVIGGATSIANAMLQQATGKDLGGHVLATLGFDDAAGAQPASQVAAAPKPGADGTDGASQSQTKPAPQNPARPAQQPPQQAPQQPPASTAGPASAVMAQLQPQQQQGSVAPGGGISGGLAAAAARAPQAQGFDPTQVMNSGHVPNKMPKRDAMLASTMPHGSQASNLERAPAVNMTGPVLPQMRSASAAPSASAAVHPAPGAVGSAPASANNAAPANPASSNPAVSANAVSANGAPANAPVASRDAMAEIMMRNLAKYQAEKRAQTHTMRTSS